MLSFTSFSKGRKTLHAPESTQEVRLILRELPLDTTYDVAQQNFTPSCFISFQEEEEIKKEMLLF